MAKFQIRRDGLVGIALYDREDAHQALLDFFADRRRGELRDQVEERDDGSASITVDGQTFTANRIEDG